MSQLLIRFKILLASFGFSFPDFLFDRILPFKDCQFILFIFNLCNSGISFFDYRHLGFYLRYKYLSSLLCQPEGRNPSQRSCYATGLPLYLIQILFLQASISIADVNSASFLSLVAALQRRGLLSQQPLYDIKLV